MVRFQLNSVNIWDMCINTKKWSAHILLWFFIILSCVGRIKGNETPSQIDIDLVPDLLNGLVQEQLLNVGRHKNNYYILPMQLLFL